MDHHLNETTTQNQLLELIDNLNNQEDVNITCAALLIETAYADKTLEKDEINSLRSCLQEVYGLEEQIVESLIIESEASIKNSTSLYEYTKPLNDNLNYLHGVVWLTKSLQRQKLQILSIFFS